MRLRAELVLDLARDLPTGMNVVDLGCGTGYFTGLLVERGLHVQAADLVERNLAVLRRLHPESRPCSPISPIFRSPIRASTRLSASRCSSTSMTIGLRSPRSRACSSRRQALPDDAEQRCSAAAPRAPATDVGSRRARSGAPRSRRLRAWRARRPSGNGRLPCHQRHHLRRARVPGRPGFRLDGAPRREARQGSGELDVGRRGGRRRLAGSCVSTRASSRLCSLLRGSATSATEADRPC